MPFVIIPKHMIEGRSLINYFLAAQVADMVITKLALNLPGFQEINPLGAEQQTVLLKWGITLALVLLYAVTQDRESKLTKPVEKAIKIDTVLMYVVLLGNAAQVFLELPL